MSKSVSDTDDFFPLDFPEIVQEVEEIKARLQSLRKVDKEIIIVAYLKNPTIRVNLAQSETKLVDALTLNNGSRQLEDLFAACCKNKRFTQSLEDYIITQLNK